MARSKSPPQPDSTSSNTPRRSPGKILSRMSTPSIEAASSRRTSVTSRFSAPPSTLGGMSTGDSLIPGASTAGGRASGCGAAGVSGASRGGSAGI
ncbi:hypothetical protein E2C01_003045 [Portunus trituberculatus]|uniref:Uncharacterized protein n=1 Tax=Portunus trituberculatus TaxID=210409 RepID=A0A5B7CNP8_PORTR|nr:hypothetical protein [Portunus trituberculatus]